DGCDMNETSSSRSSFTSDDGDEDRNWFTMTWKGGGCSIKIDGRGKITFTPAEDDVATISDRGSFEIQTDDGSTSRSYKVISRGGSLERRYQLNDKDATLDAEALKWRSAMILEFIRRSGYDAKGRAARIRKKGGIDALVAEIGALRSDGVRATYIEIG